MNNKLVMIADDDKASYFILKYIVSKAGHTVIWAKNGQEAIEKYHSNNVNLVFMDVDMPLLNGLEATAHLKSLNKELPVIMLTSYEKFKLRCLEAGCDEFMVKPVERAHIEKILTKYLSPHAANN